MPQLRVSYSEGTLSVFCMEEGFALKDALWHVLADKEHRMQHWILKLTIANARQDVSKVQKLEQRLAALEKQRKRSRSPRRQAQRALPAQQALPAKRTGRNRRKGGRKVSIAPFVRSSGFPLSENYFKRTYAGSFSQPCARMPIARASTYVSDAARQIRSTIPAAASSQRSELAPHL